MAVVGWAWVFVLRSIKMLVPKLDKILIVRGVSRTRDLNAKTLFDDRMLDFGHDGLLRNWGLCTAARMWHRWG